MADFKLAFKSLNKKGNRAIFGGLRTVIWIPVDTIQGAPDAAELMISGPLVGPVEKKGRTKMTKEERAALPKPTLAEKIARQEARLAKMRKQQESAQQPVAAL